MRMRMIYLDMLESVDNINDPLIPKILDLIREEDISYYSVEQKMRMRAETLNNLFEYADMNTADGKRFIAKIIEEISIVNREAGAIDDYASLIYLHPLFQQKGLELLLTLADYDERSGHVLVDEYIRRSLHTLYLSDVSMLKEALLRRGINYSISDRSIFAHFMMSLAYLIKVDPNICNYIFRTLEFIKLNISNNDTLLMFIDSLISKLRQLN